MQRSDELTDQQEEFDDLEDTPAMLGPARVVHLIDAMEPGGAERVLATIVTGLDRARYRARVLCLVKRGAVADELRLAGMTVDCFEFDLKNRWREIRRLAGWLRQHEIEVLHTHGYSAGVLGRLAGLIARVPVMLAHLHTTDRNLRLHQRWIERALSYATDRVICCSHAVAHFAERELGLPLGKLSVIHNGVVMARFKDSEGGGGVRRRFGISAQEPVIGIVAGLTPHKGHNTALRALARLRVERPKARLLIIGDGPERQRMQQLAKELGLLPAVVFVGRQAEVAPFIAACDLICLPSSVREGFSLALAEAMAMGKAVVASDVGGVSEVVVHGVTGMLVAPRDVEQLAQAFEQMLDDDNRREAMGLAGRRRMEQLFDADLMVRRVEGLYDELREHRSLFSRRYRTAVVGRRRATVLYTTGSGSLAGGGQQSLMLLLSHLDLRRFRPVVLCPARGDLSERVEASGIEVIVSRLPSASLRTAIPALRAVWKLTWLLRGRHIALAHTDAPRETLYAGLAAWLCRFNHAPMVWHVRASNGEWSDPWLVGLSSRLILVANALRTRFRMSVPTDQMERLVVIHNGVEPPQHGDEPKQIRQRLQRELGIDPQTVLMAVIGRVEQLKGSEILVDALGLLPANLDYRLLFLGSVDPEYRAALMAKAEALGVAEWISFPGHRSPIQPWIEAVDMLVHPSIFEAFPRVILEAMAASKPVVGTLVGGVGEAVVEGETGFLAPAGNASALAQAMARLIKDRPLRERMGRSGRQRAEDCFGAEEHVRKVEAIYRTLLGEGR